jgi:hypothetical protein
MLGAVSYLQERRNSRLALPNTRLSSRRETLKLASISSDAKPGLSWIPRYVGGEIGLSAPV